MVAEGLALVSGGESGWRTALRGRLIVFDGPDGSGKSTQLRRFVQAIRGPDLDVVDVRDPGGTVVGERIRDVLLDARLAEMGPRTELMLYMASRAQLVAEHIAPALARGACVCADRYVSSTLAYQGTAGGIGEDEILDVARAACGACWPPDLTIVFDVDQATAAARLNPLLDRMEQKGAAFHARVREGFLAQARRWPERTLVIDARGDLERIAADVVAGVRDRAAAWAPGRVEA